MKFEEIIAFVPVIMLVFLCIYIAYGLLMLLGSYLKGIQRSIALAFSHRLNAGKNRDLEEFLRNRFAYYDKLSDPLKTKFMLRVKFFISDKEFEGREGLEITDEIKTW